MQAISNADHVSPTLCGQLDMLPSHTINNLHFFNASLFDYKELSLPLRASVRLKGTCTVLVDYYHIIRVKHNVNAEIHMATQLHIKSGYIGKPRRIRVDQVSFNSELYFVLQKHLLHTI